MVLGNLMFTVAGNGLAKGTKAPKPKGEKKTEKAASVTPATDAGGTPASITTGAERDNAVLNDAAPDGSESPLFVFSEDEEPFRPAVSAAHTDQTVTQAPIEPTPVSDEIVNTIEDATAAPTSQPEDESNALILDPNVSERQHYRDPFTGIQREIWRPGDGDGAPGADYYERPGQLPPVQQRWRFYQVKTGDGPMRNKINMPPKYVILDDRAAYEVSASDIPKATSVKFWSHDFGGAGKLRARRPHRGRGAIRDPDAEGDEKYNTAPIGMKNDKYYFTGEKDYKPIIYRVIVPDSEATETSVEQSGKRKATSPAMDERKDPRKHGHNQYTPKEDLVRYGAPSAAKDKDRYRARINTFLRRSPTPPFSKDRSKLYGGIGDQAHAFTASAALQGVTGASTAVQDVTGNAMAAPTDDREESIWVEQDEDAQVAENSGEEPTTFMNTATQQTSPIELAVDTSSDASPFARLVNKAQMLEPDADRAEDVIENFRRKKLPQPMSFMERMAASTEAPAVDTSPKTQEKKTIDSGSYASQLERELAEANETIDSLTSAYQQAQDRVEELEAEVAALHEEIGDREG